MTSDLDQDTILPCGKKLDLSMMYKDLWVNYILQILQTVS